MDGQRFGLPAAGITGVPYEEPGAIRFAAGLGLDEPGFHALPDAAKYAWGRHAFNEPAYAALAGPGNVHAVRYESLCASPDALVRDILALTVLDWTTQTGDFVARSKTHRRQAGYCAVFRDAVAAARHWRRTMPAADQAAVRTMMSGSRLKRFWPESETEPLRNARRKGVGGIPAIGTMDAGRKMP